MKSLPLKNPSFRYVEKSFKDWLDIQGFAATTVYNLPTHIRELLHYLESQGINHIKELEVKHIYAHYEKLKERTHQRRSGGLSNGHLNKHIQALRKFTDYLRKVGRIQLPALKLDNEEENHKITFLTEEEIKELFNATEKRPERPSVSEETLLAMQARDRAMLAVYYGCGLRRNEGVHLNLSDINFDKSILHVRKGKNYKERFVPISKTSINYLQEYIYDHRNQLVKSSTIDALFLGQRGLRMQGQSLFIRLKLLQAAIGKPEPIGKGNRTPHTQAQHSYSLDGRRNEDRKYQQVFRSWQFRINTGVYASGWTGRRAGLSKHPNL